MEDYLLLTTRGVRMKKLIKLSEKYLKRITIWDWALLAKPALLLLGMIVGAYISGFVKSWIYVFVTAVVILDAILFYRIFKKKK